MSAKSAQNGARISGAKTSSTPVPEQMPREEEKPPDRGERKKIRTFFPEKMEWDFFDYP